MSLVEPKVARALEATAKLQSQEAQLWSLGWWCRCSAHNGSCACASITGRSFRRPYGVDMWRFARLRRQAESHACSASFLLLPRDTRPRKGVPNGFAALAEDFKALGRLTRRECVAGKLLVKQMSRESRLANHSV